MKMEKEFIGEYVSAKRASDYIDNDTIQMETERMKEIEERLEIIVRKIEEAKSLCSRDSLSIQGYSMEETLEEFQKAISNTAYNLGDLAHNISTTANRLMVRKQLIFNEEARIQNEEEKLKHTMMG